METIRLLPDAENAALYSDFVAIYLMSQQKESAGFVSQILFLSVLLEFHFKLLAKFVYIRKRID